MIPDNEREAGLGGTVERDAAKPRRFLRLFLLAVLVGGLVAFFLSGADRYLSFQTLRDHRAELLVWVSAHALAAALLYMLIYALVVAFSLPGGLLMTVTGGFLFGQIMTTFLVVASATVGAVAVFLAARTILGDALRAKIGGKLALLEKGFRRNAFNYLLVLRLVPLFPFFVVNLVPAFLGMPLRSYTIATFIGIIPATFVFAQLGTGLGSILESGEDFELANALTGDVAAALAGLAVLALVPIVYKRFFTVRDVC